VFELRDEMHAVPWDGEAVLEFYTSVNQPQISAQGHDAQEASACFYSSRSPEGIEAYIGLYMCTSNVLLVYQWAAPIGREDYTDVQTAAIEFTESMGFMMEDLQMRKRDLPERLEMLQNWVGFAQTAAAAEEESVVLEEDTGGDELIVELDAEQTLPPDETILDLQAEMPSTQVGGSRPASQAAAPADTGDPLEDKNFKVFLRLLTSA
jgi:hypothetical protein